jgi:hypothetical protein
MDVGYDSPPMDTSRSLAARVLPVGLTAAGAVLLALGLLTYSDRAAAIDPSPSPRTTPAASARPSPTGEPSASPSPSPTASPVAAVATRVVIAGLAIDLPVIEGPDTYPPCGVAMYLPELHQPGEAGATYLFAHARAGMFEPLLLESRRADGERMLGMLVQVFTADDRLHLYEITEVRPVVPFETALDEPFAATTDQLWLQTSIGPAGTKPKMQVVAEPLSVGPADPAEAHPTPKPVSCG